MRKLISSVMMLTVTAGAVCVIADYIEKHPCVVKKLKDLIIGEYACDEEDDEPDTASETLEEVQEASKTEETGEVVAPETEVAEEKETDTVNVLKL